MDKPIGAIMASAAAPAAPQLSCTPQDVEAGGTLTCEVRLATALAGGVEISVSSSHPSLHVPAGIISRPYQSSVSFQALVDANAPPQTMTIQAALGSLVAQSQIAVQPSALPVVSAPGAQKTLFGAKLSFRVTAASGLGQGLAVRADRLPPGAAFDPATGDFEWTASPAQSGRWETVFTTTDELGRSATAKVPIQAGSGRPEIDHVENAASGSRETVCSSGSLATIRGAWLANGSASDFTGTATSLAGTEVLVDGQTTPVVFVSPTEVTFVCPQTERSEVSVSVETAMAVSAPATAAVAASAPGIFTTDGSGSGQATATIFEGSRLAMPRNYRYPSQPAQAGDNLSILMTGVVADADPSTLAVRMGDLETHATSVRPVAGATGVVQVELTIPAAAPVGDAVPIRVRQGLPGTGGRESQPATIAIEASR
ncbi:MAG TPA: putative Ig domain-containing protein [Bryobacteraceae bacterium]